MPEASAKKASKSAAKVKTEKVVESADKEKKVVKQKRRQKRPYGRLYSRAVFTGFRRGLRNQHENTALLKVDGCDSKADSWFYVGKRVAYVYRVCMNVLFLHGISLLYKILFKFSKFLLPTKICNLFSMLSNDMNSF